MKLIVGFGNPGAKYKNTRHNIGFMVVASFAKNNEYMWRYSGDLMCNYVKTKEFILVKSTIYMNKSGQSVLAVCNYYDIDPKDILVVHDDLDMEFGKIRLAFGGRSAGHHGVESIIESLGTMDFARLRVGIGSPLYAGAAGLPKSKIVEKYVLSDFGEEEMKQLGGIIRRCEEAMRSYIDDGIDATMNKFN